MISIRLWGSLRSPPAKHALFRKIVRQFKPPGWGRYFPLALVITGVLAYVGIFEWSLFFLLPLFLLGGLLLLAVSSGTSQVNGIAAVIAAERRTGRYNLVCLMPDGELGLNWMLATAFINRETYNPSEKCCWWWGTRIILWLGTLMFCFAGSAGCAASLFYPRSQDFYYREPGFIDILPGTIAILVIGLVILVANYRQSSVLSALVAMFVPTLSTNPYNVRLLASGLYFVIQSLVYILTVLVVVIVGQIIQSGQTDSGLVIFGLMLLMIVPVFILRELAIHALWRWLLRRLNTNLDEVPSLLDWSS